jgi:ParB family chromosome partitioning protein
MRYLGNGRAAWQCPQCETHNDASVASCLVCHFSKEATMTITAAAKTTRPKRTTKKERAGHSAEEWEEIKKLGNRLLDAGVPVAVSRIVEWTPKETNDVTAWLDILEKGPGHHARLPEILVGHLPIGWKRPGAGLPTDKDILDLKALNPAAQPKADDPRRQLPITALVPSPTNPRRTFTKEALDQLAESIKNVGILQPILVRPHAKKAGHFEIVAGERRYRAAKQAGLALVPVDVRDLDDKQVLEIQLVENLERQDLNAIEEAIAFQQLVETAGYSERKLAERLKLSQGHISNRIRLLKLPEAWQKRVISGEITPTDGRELARWAERPLVLKAIEKEGRHAFRDMGWAIERAVKECSRPLSGSFNEPGNWRWVEVALSNKDKEREDLDLEEIKGLGKRAFNIKLWNELQAAGEKKRAERKAKANGQENGKAEGAISPTEAKRKTEQKDRQWKTRLYRYKVGWLQRQIVERLGDLDFADHKSEALLLRCGLLLASRDRVPHAPLIEAIAAAGGTARGDLHGKSAWAALQSIPDDQTMTVLRNLVQAVVQCDNLESYNSPIKAAHIEGLAANLGIDIKTDWRLEEEFLLLHTKDSLEAIALEWHARIKGTKRSEIITELLAWGKNASCPKELAALKPQF